MTRRAMLPVFHLGRAGQAIPRTGARRRGTYLVPFALRVLLLAVVPALAACSRGFELKDYPTPDRLYKASLAELNRKKYDNAITGFERLTLDLSARDSLLPLAHWYLGKAHVSKEEHLLAAQSYSRLAESFPDDSLAPRALLAAGDEYFKLWRSPALDPQYGLQAQSEYRLLASIYVDSPLGAAGQQGSLKVDEWMATKDYDVGLHYVRRRAYDSALIYFKDVVKNYPNTSRAREALLRMVETYRRPTLNYKEEASETCASLRAAYAGDKEVVALCPAPAEAAGTVPPAAPAAAGSAATPKP